jgi:hypothetical protein
MLWVLLLTNVVHFKARDVRRSWPVVWPESLHTGYSYEPDEARVARIMFLVPLSPIAHTIIIRQTPRTSLLE